MLDIQYILSTFLLLFSAALVFWMAAGFSMLECGLVRAANAIDILKKNVGLYCVSAIFFAFGGYSIMYGNFEGIGHSSAADLLFQMVFVATAASIISGTIAERAKFWPFMVLVALLSLVIYPIQGAWTWGGGWLSEMGFSDFAGSTIVHSVGGWAALAGAILLGSRKGRYNSDGTVNSTIFEPSNLTAATIGTFILWLGWFGFNGGSQLAMASKADIDAIAAVFANTHIAAVAGSLAALALSFFINKEVNLLFMLNGALAGLVAITAGPDYPSLELAVLIGAIGGVIMFGFIPLFDRLRVDDPVGALSVHLVPGIWGTLAVGIFKPDGSVIAQLQGIGIIGAFVFVSSFVIWFILKKTIGINSEEK
jgi:Amt family ammonium transporter